MRYAQKCIEWCRKLTKAFGKAGGLFKKLDDVLASASVNLAKRSDDFATVLKQGANADIACPMKDAGAGAKKVVVDGVTGLPKDIGPAMAEEFRREGAKIVDTRSWKDWRELREDQEREERGG